MNSQEVITLALTALDDLKGIDIVEIDIRDKSSIADSMVVATGTSQRHVRSLADNVRLKAKGAGVPPIGVEGEDSGEWVLVDLGDVIVHVMTEESRGFYSLEKLWSVGSSASESDSEGRQDSADLDSTADGTDKSGMLSSV